MESDSRSAVRRGNRATRRRPHLPLFRRYAVEETTAVGQERRSGVALLAWPSVVAGWGSPPAAGTSGVRCRRRRENDDPLRRTPGAAEPRGWRRLAQRDRRTAGHVDFLELSPGEECQRPAVRRPERGQPTLGAGESACFERIEGACLRMRGSECLSATEGDVAGVVWQYQAGAPNCATPVGSAQRHGPFRR